jgi:hypothetical protein
MTAVVLMVASAAILFVIGALHLSGTFLGSGLTPRDPALRKSMDEISPVETEEATMWREDRDSVSRGGPTSETGD